MIQTEEIHNLEMKLIEAIKTSDVSFLETILNDDLQFIAPNGMLITKQMDLDSHRKKTMVVESINAKLEEIKILNDTAIVIIVYQTKGKMLGNPIEGSFRYLRIWKLMPNGFQIIAGSCTQIES
ncbi:nuclear transport factor 2 family protein [Leptospira yanagawae]|uniref:Nuclear transport factor 2 family protein n=1 Tax=Leptospira yanagawae TaxID=293069 RepID=A0ABY2M4A6_9LEPT|nr:nuclear transport factor 2 family protein [Leptospira yanagawae]TGL24026.1 nuclear transport factor 2 family protein [Leptospira yanagawae]